jgi:hypothetical protein
VRRKNKYKSRSPIWTWVSFIVFGLIITLLLTSLIQKKSPSEVIKNIWQKTKPDPSLSKNMSKKDLIALVEGQDSTIFSLQAALEDCRHDDGFNKAYIATKTESLNMRSEPNLSSTIIMKIPNKSRVSILSYDDIEYYLDGANGKWCRIQYNELEGWVWGNYLNIPQ